MVFNTYGHYLDIQSARYNSRLLKTRAKYEDQYNENVRALENDIHTLERTIGKRAETINETNTSMLAITEYARALTSTNNLSFDTYGKIVSGRVLMEGKLRSIQIRDETIRRDLSAKTASDLRYLDTKKRVDQLRIEAEQIDFQIKQMKDNWLLPVMQDLILAAQFSAGIQGMAGFGQSYTPPPSFNFPAYSSPTSTFQSPPLTQQQRLRGL